MTTTFVVQPLATLKAGDKIKIQTTLDGVTLTSDVYTYEQGDAYSIQVVELGTQLRHKGQYTVLVAKTLPTTPGSVILLDAVDARDPGEDVIKGSVAILTKDAGWVTANLYGNRVTVWNQQILHWRPALVTSK